MLAYFQRLKQIWPKDAEKIFIIKTTLISHGILNESGMGISYPLAITVEKEEAIKGIFHELAGFGNPAIISLELPKKEFAKSMEDVEYELLPVICNDIGERSMDNLTYLSNCMMSGKASGKVFNAVPVVAFKGAVPEEAVSYLAGKISFEGEQTKVKQVNTDEDTRKIIQFICDNASTIKCNVQSVGREGKGNAFFLTGIEEVIKMILKFVQAETDITAYFCDAIENMKENWGIENDGEVWIDELRDIIIDDTKNIRKIINRKDTRVESLNVLEEYPLYDEEYYYFTTEYFDRLCAKIPYISRSELKRTLANLKILVGQGYTRGYYTVKVPVKTLHGIKIIGRRMRISRKWLDSAGELTWQEKIEVQGEAGIRCLKLVL